MVRDEYNHSRPVSALIRDWLLYNKAGGGGGILKTVTGNPISVTDALAAPIKSLSVSLSPIQEGSGDPSPDNVRPITGRTAVTVWREAVYDPSADPVLTIQLGQTVYGGTVDVTGGSALKTMDIRDLSALTWRYYATDNYFYATMDNRFPNGTNGKGFCSSYKFYGTANSATLAAMPDMNFGFTSNSGSKYIYIKDPRYTDAASFQAAVAGVQLVYDLQPSSYEEITTEPTTLSTLKGQNNVWSDGDSVEMTYIADPKLYIDKKITAAVAALA